MNLAVLVRQGRSAGIIPVAESEDGDIFLEYQYAIELNGQHQEQTITHSKDHLFRLHKQWQERYPKDDVRGVRKLPHEQWWTTVPELRNY